jgi:hypothetical protein
MYLNNYEYDNSSLFIYLHYKKKKIFLCRLPRFQGQSEATLSGEAELSSMTVKKAWSRPPISMDFQVLMFTSSGLLVRFLKVFEKSNYTSVKWVRYMTKAGSYQIRVRKFFIIKFSY